MANMLTFTSLILRMHLNCGSIVFTVCILQAAVTLSLCLVNRTNVVYVYKHKCLARTARMRGGYCSNPRCACARVTVVVVCVCLCIRLFPL